MKDYVTAGTRESPLFMREVALSCLKTMLRPVVRFALRGSVLLNDIIAVLKSLYVEVGAEELQKITPKVNVSRLSLMTGVHRRDVTAIYREGGDPLFQPANMWSRVIGQWEQDRRFRTKGGDPRALSCNGVSSEFYDLVSRVSKNINPGTVLFDLERVGLISRKGDTVTLNQKLHRIDGFDERGFDVLARDMESLCVTVLNNMIDNPDEPQHHIRTEYDNILVDRLPEIREWVLEEGRQFHARVRSYLSSHDKDIAAGASQAVGGARVSVSSSSLIVLPPAASPEAAAERTRGPLQLLPKRRT